MTKYDKLCTAVHCSKLGMYCTYICMYMLGQRGRNAERVGVVCKDRLRDELSKRGEARRARGTCMCA